MSKEMKNKDKFLTEMKKAYKRDGITLGAALLDDACLSQVKVTIPIKTLNRHGLISGATGTGKTATLQSLTENLSSNGIPVLLMDIKGDLSGLAKPGEKNKKIEERQKAIGIPYKARGYPVEFYSLSGEKGAKMRATVSEFGPILLSKILGLNDTQSGVIAIIFKYCDDKKLPLVDLKDLKSVMQYILEEGKPEIDENYGKISTSTTGIILRKIVELEQQGATTFFGEKSFEVEDLLKTKDGLGCISIIRLTDIQDKPKLFSTFMLTLLGEIYSLFPEEGDLDQPKLVIFIDEAHLIFEEASKALLNQIESIIKLIRSKGVGIIFCTQDPTDVPAKILGQLGLKIQHSLRAFTAKDRKAIKLASENFPSSKYYDIDEMLTSLGIGEALITALNEKGQPTPLIATLLCAPSSRMGTLTAAEIKEIASSSKLADKYNKEIDSDSAHEMLIAKIKDFHAKKMEQQKPGRRGKAPKSTLETVVESKLARQVGRTLVREATRGLLGVLGLGGRRR